MSLIFATQLTAIATAVLAAGAIVTAIFAILAFRKQSQEVHDQAEELRVQSEVLEVQSRELNLRQEQREREADEQRRSQAARVTAWLTHREPDGLSKAHISNDSDQPVFDVRTSFYYMRKKARRRLGGHRPRKTAPRRNHMRLPSASRSSRRGPRKHPCQVRRGHRPHLRRQHRVQRRSREPLGTRPSRRLEAAFLKASGSASAISSSTPTRSLGHKLKGRASARPGPAPGRTLCKLPRRIPETRQEDRAARLTPIALHGANNFDAIRRFRCRSEWEPS
jgi:hypothetical protein